MLPLPSSTPSSSAWRPADADRASACRRSGSRTGRRGRARTAASARRLPWKPESRRSVAKTMRPSGWRSATAMRVAAAHQDAFDQGLAAVVVAGHAAKSTRWVPAHPSAAGLWRSRRHAAVRRGVHDRRVSGAGCGSSSRRTRCCCARASSGSSRTRGRRSSRASATARRWSPRSWSTGRTCRSWTSGCRRRQRDEGLRAAIEARRLVPGSPVLVLSQYVERAVRERAARRPGGRRRLPAEGPGRRRPRVHGRARAGSPRAAPRSTPRSSPSSWSAAGATTGSRP